MDTLRATAIEISGFRCFKQFKAEGFERINLLVGKNNSGKTALLEALEIGLSGGHPARVALQLLRRQARYLLTSPIEQFVRERELFLDARQLFHGHKLTARAELTIGVQSGPVRSGLGLKHDPLHGQLLQATNLARMADSWELQLYENAAVQPKELAEKARKDGEDDASVRFVDTSRTSAESLAKIWKH